MMLITSRPFGRSRPPTAAVRLADGWDRPVLRDLSRSLDLPARLETGRTLVETGRTIADRTVREALDQMPIRRDRQTRRRRRMALAIVVGSAALGLIAWWSGRKRVARPSVDAAWSEDVGSAPDADRSPSGVSEPMTEMSAWSADAALDDHPVREAVAIGIVPGSRLDGETAQVSTRDR
jgi:hypothetical protein